MPDARKKTVRQLPNGTVEVVSTFRKVGTIKGSVKTTGMHLIRRYVEAWAAASLTTKDLPNPAGVYISTNRVELSERLNRSHRSVYDHIRKLRQVGLVDNYRFCGRQHDFNRWLLIRSTLYSRHEWSENENFMAGLEIYDHLFGRFTPAQSEKAWKDYTGELTERLEMAKAWFDKHAQRHPDYPFQRGKKMGYFDPKNNFGFAVTALWLAKDKLRKRQNRVEYLLNQARIDFEKLAAGHPRPKVMDKNELQLFVYYQNWVKTYGKEVEERFCKQYPAQKTRKFAPAKPPRLSIRAQKAADKATQTVYVEPWMEMEEYY